jgi:predicted amidohydrolase YtcJ
MKILVYKLRLMNTKERFFKLLLSSFALVLMHTCGPGPVTPTPTVGPPEVRGDPIADLVFYNGVLLTMNPEHPQARAIAVRSDRILAVGRNEDMLPWIGPETLRINLHGKTLLPGLADGHTHILWIPPDMTLDEVQDLVLSYGFTSVTEMTSSDGHLERLLQAEADGRLRLRVNVFVRYNDGHLDENGNTILLQYWYPENGPVLDSARKLRVPGIKVFVDGAGTPARGCPAMREPYNEATRSEEWFQQSCGSKYGDLYWPDQEELNQVVADAQAAGYRVAFHAMGDKGIEAALDAIAFALDGQPNSSVRHQIQHSSFLSPDLMQRYVEMDMLSSVRGYFNTCEQATYDNHVASNRYALPGLGVHAYLETDAGWAGDPTDISRSNTLNPMVQLWGLVTHRQLRVNGRVCTPDPWIARHVITVDQALRMMTYEPAYAVSQEDVLGTLEPGKYADLIILSGNPMTVASNNLRNLEVWMTMVGGQVEYCKAGHEGLCPGWQPETPEPVTIKLFKEEQQQVPAGTPVQLTIGWVADTEEQVADFLAAVSMTGTLDGLPLPDLNGYWGEIESFESNYGDHEGFLSNWLYPLGVLNPGTHTVEVLGSLDQPVTDGYDANDDGQPDEYSGEVWNFTLHIEVEQ